MKKHLLRSIALLSILTLYLPATAQQSVTHQNVFDTIPFIMEHHKRRLEKFSKEPMSTGKILFLGNSITEGRALGRTAWRSNGR